MATAFYISHMVGEVVEVGAEESQKLNFLIFHPSGPDPAFVLNE